MNPTVEMYVSAANLVKAPVDKTLTISDMAADAKVTGDAIRTNTADIADLKTDAPKLVRKPTTNPDGTNGQLLRTKGDGTTEWVTTGTPTDTQVTTAVDAWLDDHPDATTTVEDGAISRAKLTTDLKRKTDLAGVSDTDIASVRKDLMDFGYGLISEVQTEITNATVTSGYRYAVDGSLVANTPSTGTSEAVEISVEGGERIRWVCYRANYDNTYDVKYKMSDNSIIPDVNYTDANDYTFTVPAGCVKLLVSCWVVEAVGNTFYLISTTVDPVKGELDELSAEVNTKLTCDVGTNLFDKTGSRTPITTGYYRSYNSGSWVEQEDYEVASFVVTAGEHYAVNTDNTHVCFFSNAAMTTYVSGFLVNSTNGYTFTVPSGCVAMSVSPEIATADTFQIQKGTTVTPYTPFKFGVNPSDILWQSIHRVGPGKEYSTIQAAINAASDGDIILIDAGTYTEALEATGKTLHFIGMGPKATIVTYAGDDYNYPPLEIASGMVENMAFITTATEKAVGAIDTAYCVHIDYDAAIGKSLQFKNCYFESPIRPTVGIGLRQNFTLNFTDCHFKSSALPVYCHEQQASNKTGQRLELINCTMQSTTASPTVVLQETPTYTGNHVDVLFQRCIAKAAGATSLIIGTTYPGSGTPTGSNYLNLNCFYLDSNSALNNANVLNA